MDLRVPNGTTRRFESNYSLDPEQIEAWVEAFHQQGFLFIENVLTEEHVAFLKSDLEWSLNHFLPCDEDPAGKLSSREKGDAMRLCHRMFEHSRANLNLFDLEPVVSFAEALIAKNCHVIHNNSFTTPPGGGISRWHQDDPPHLIVTSGPPPTNIRLPVLAFTCNYYLTDVTEVEHGSTEVIPGSHLFGTPPPSNVEGTEWKKQACCNLGKAGSVIMFNSQVWHRGGPNRSDRVRYITQVTYARRLVGHKYYPFMNYIMPEHVIKDANPRLKRLLGFLEHGAYG